jgi:5'(3')-deoxyribonucleotidase
MKINVYIDLDNTFFDYKKQFAQYHLDNTGESKFDIKWDGYRVHEKFGLTYEDRYKYLSQQGFFDSMPAMDKAVEVVNALNTNECVNILFVSNGVVPEAYHGKINALTRLLPWFDIAQLVMLKDKHLLDSGIIIDDNPTVLENCMDKHFVIAFTQDYNTESPCHERANTWNDVAKIICRKR